MRNDDINDQKILKKLDIIISLLQNILILQGSNMEINQQELRKIAGIAMNKVTNVTKLLKNSESSSKVSK